MNPRKSGVQPGQAALLKPGQKPVNSQPSKPHLLQPKMATTLQMRQPPVAPPAYRPQAAPKAVQPRTVNATQNRKPTVAPSAFRQQSVPTVLQTKMAGGQPPQAGQTPRQPVAPPVYRPEAKRIAQPKMAATTQTSKQIQAPPVYHPQSGRGMNPSGSGADMMQGRTIAARAGHIVQRSATHQSTVQPKTSGTAQSTRKEIAAASSGQARPQAFPRPASSVIQRHLAVGTYVRVYDNGGEWYGKIATVNDGEKKYGVRVGGTDKVVPVPFHKAGLHTAFIASGQVPEDFKTKPLNIAHDVWSYHVTAAANLPRILEKGGLIPRGTGAHTAFGGLDPARGAGELGGVPERLGQLSSAMNSVPESYQGTFKRKLHDAMLGSKEDFVYATRDPKRIFNYADEIRTKGHVDKIIVFRFLAGQRAWYLDEEDDTAEKTISSIPKTQLQAAKFQRTEEDVSNEVARQYLQGLTWYPLTDDLGMRFLLIWAT